MDVTYVVITWLGIAGPLMHELPMSERACKGIKARTEVVFQQARTDDPEFGFILECRPIPKENNK